MPTIRPRLQYTVEDLRHPERLERVLRQIEALVQSEAAQAAAMVAPAAARAATPAIPAGPVAPPFAPPIFAGDGGGGGDDVVIGTHSDRLIAHPAINYPAGTLFWETDRTVFYVVTSESVGPTWRYAAGRYIDIFAMRPADLGLYDQGFRFLSWDTAHRLWWNVDVWRLENEVTDTFYDQIQPILYLMHRVYPAGPAPAAGLGASVEYYLENSARLPKPAGALAVAWASALDGNESADVKFRLMFEGAPYREVMTFLSNGDVLMHIPQRRLCFGGLTSGFGSIGAVGTTVRAALADGSGYTDFEVKDEAYGPGWDGSLEVPTKNALYDKIETISSTIQTGVYTPTATILDNLTDVETYPTAYTRINDHVIVSGQIGVTPTAPSVSTTVDISLPFSSGITTPEDLGGAAACDEVQMSAAIYGASATNRARFDWISPVSGSLVGLSFSFQYRIK